MLQVPNEPRMLPTGDVNVMQLDARLREVDRKARSSVYEAKKESLVRELEDFLKMIPGGGDIRSVDPQNVRRFLVYKDRKGKTQTHSSDCKFLGEKGCHNCACPKRLAAGTVASLVGQLKAIFKKMGRGDEWDEVKNRGNPAHAGAVADYLKVFSKESSEAHVLPKQAKPLFLDKVEKVCDFLTREASCELLPVRERFLAYRDRAFFSVQFHAGDRAGDLSKTRAQEVKELLHGDGLMVQLTQGKTTSSVAPRVVVLRKCPSSAACPVRNLKEYVQGARDMGVDLTCGFLFRKTDEASRVLEVPISYDVAYSRLKKYLCNLGLYSGETPHSLRGGCAVTLRLSGAAEGISDIQDHVGWRSKSMPLRYSRVGKGQNMEISGRLQKAVEGGKAREVEALFAMEAYERLPVAFK